MGWFSDDSDPAQCYDQVVNKPHEASWSHELIAGAAAYEAEKAYQKHCDENGKPSSHEEAKDILAGFAGAFVDREVETRGLNFIDREKAKHQAKQHYESQLQNDYGY